MLFFSWLSNLCLEITLSLVFCRFCRRASNLFHMVNCCRLVSPSRVFLSPFMMTEVSIWLFKLGKRSLKTIHGTTFVKRHAKGTNPSDPYLLSWNLHRN